MTESKSEFIRYQSIIKVVAEAVNKGLVQLWRQVVYILRALVFAAAIGIADFQARFFAQGLCIGKAAAVGVVVGMKKG